MLVHTIRLSTSRGLALEDLALVLQIDIPTLLLAVLVLQRDGVDAGALLNSVLALGLIVEGLVDEIEGGRSRECGCLFSEVKLAAALFRSTMECL